MFVQLKVFEHCQSVLAIYIYDDDKARDVPCTFKLVLNVRRTFSRKELDFQQCSANCLLCNCMLALALCYWAESQMIQVRKYICVRLFLSTGFRATLKL